MEVDETPFEIFSDQSSVAYNSNEIHNIKNKKRNKISLVEVNKLDGKLVKVQAIPKTATPIKIISNPIQVKKAPKNNIVGRALEIANVDTDVFEPEMEIGDKSSLESSVANDTKEIQNIEDKKGKTLSLVQAKDKDGKIITLVKVQVIPKTEAQIKKKSNLIQFKVPMNSSNLNKSPKTSSESFIGK